ncbi:MAG: lycopene beta-cyclase CrtY [Myxococcales bacterium]|nr:lycopene beta-cyclase CrtY [Myxococcales bacterium]
MSWDIVLVGGGLQNGLIALTVLAKCPETRLLLIEAEQALGGNHTWCFHDADVPSSIQDVVAPLVDVRWEGYRVRFPDLERSLDLPYSLVSSERFARVIKQRVENAPNAEIWTNTRAEELRVTSIVLEDGRQVDGALIVDGRGPLPDAFAGACGYQKFLGLEVRTSTPHGITRPILMDACVPQDEGFRFVYVLPLDHSRLLIEDTYFTDTSALDLDKLRAGLLAYAQGMGISVGEVIREEQGVLPMPWEGQRPAVSNGGPLAAGFAGGWFHPGTGYSFPIASRLAELVAEQMARYGPQGVVGTDLQELADRHERQSKFVRRLNGMLFRWFAPKDRWNVLARFYRDLPEATIRRFYALDLTTRDRARLMMGRPPRGISVRRAIRAATGGLEMG